MLGLTYELACPAQRDKGRAVNVIDLSFSSLPPHPDSKGVRHGQEKAATEGEDHCLVIGRTKPTRGAAAGGECALGRGGPVGRAGDCLKEGPGWWWDRGHLPRGCG